MHRQWETEPIFGLQKALSKLSACSLPLAVTILIGLLPLSCIPGHRYDYERIKAASFTQSPKALQRPAPVTPPESKPLSLKAAVSIALRNNPDVHMAMARIRQSEAMIVEAAAAFWPVLSVYGEYLQGDAPSAYLFKSIDQRRLPPMVDFNDPGWFENYETGIRVRLNLFNGGSDLIRIWMAQTGVAIHELDRQIVKNALITSVIFAHYDALVAREYIRIAQESVQTVQAQLRLMKVRYREGGALKSEVLSLEVRVAQAREDLIRAQNNRSRTVAALANLLGLDPDTPLAPTAGGPGYKGMPADYWSGIPYALAHRPELEKARRRISRSRMALDLARSSYLPRMDARFHYYHDTPNSTLDFESERQNWTAGIMLNWDLFTGFRTWARVQQAKGVLQEMLAADKKTAQAVRLELKTAFLRLEEAHARLAVTQASVAQARESLNLVKQQYGGGSVTVTRYLNAELAHNRARIRAAAARHDREKARAAVARALGYWGRAYPAAPPGGDPP